ncbi:P-loop containing nucleoside triphosphate hydrolase protein [Gigaspora margarita]|uniref:P-loop containing nucleoside triphosphate hydrolase protein n=1 Tax=Gigaspora margarita TaxID=4874 RepID=A0A8H3X4I1_GIGMA|nr:P-loop containing nucleoside triphosphate hydrolase protein [Gigaspora margarita]
MSIVYTLPPAIVAVVSSISIILQTIKNRKKYIEISSDEVSDDIVDDARFSTVKRDVTKLGITILQTGLYIFLFFWKFRHENKLNFDTISPGILAICWFYALTVSIIALSLKSRRWRWILNSYLTAFFFITSLCSFWQLTTGIMLRLSDSYHIGEIIEKSTVICNFIFSVVAMSIAITTPRGPPIIQNGRTVCAMQYCSIWDFISFSSVSKLIYKIYKQKTFEDDELDLLPFAFQARSLYNAFKKTRGSKLLYRILVANKRILALQLLFTMIAATLYYVPIIFLYRFLSFIQTRPENGSLEFGFLYILGMLISYILLHFTVAQNWYWASSALNVSVRGMLNSEIYSKSLKRIDSHVANVKDESNKSDNNLDASGDDNKSEDNLDTADDDNTSVGKIANLMSIDSSRISDFSVWWTSALDSPIELIVGVYFLYQLMGVSCLLGLTVMIITLPLNHQTAKLYAKTQDKLMNARDRRVGLMNEVLQGIRMIKFFSWEKNWEEKVLKARNIELKQLRNNFIYMTIFDFLWTASPILVTIFSFFFFTKIQGNELTAAVAFTSIVIFNELRFALNILPEVFTEGLQALVSVHRIEKFLDEDETKILPENDYQFTTPISFEEVTISWNEIKENNDEFTMHNLNLEFPIGELSVICGPTGSGKTLLLMSLLGETNIISGNINSPRCLTCPIDQNINEDNWIIPNNVAYVAQQTWLQNATIRDNILFGLPYNENRYNQVVKVCALEKDLQIFEDGDMTEIGEKGITLSGGQKMRVALARAVYSRAKHIYMDDIFSAVDAHTALQLMNQCILGPIMKGRTRILVTHHIRLCLADAAYLVAVNNGKIVTSGTISNLRNSGILASILDENDNQSEIVNSVELAAENAVDTSNVSEPLISSSSNFGHNIESSSASDATLVENAVLADDDSQPMKKVSKPKILVEEEERATGMVKFKIYKSYLRANGNILYWLFVAVMFFGTRGIQIMENWWLQVWSDASNNNETIPAIVNFVQPNNLIMVNGILDDIHKPHSVDYYLTIYVLITSLSIVFGVARFAYLYYGSMRVSTKLYQKLLHQVIRAPLRFFDTTPVGRILNRFSKDFETIDSTIAVHLAWFLINGLMMLGTFAVITAITKEFLVAAIFFGIIYTIVGALYAKASRELKRMDSVSRSPLYSLFTETLIGIITIRAFGASKRFMQDMLSKIDGNNRPLFYMWVINRWLSIRFNVTGSLVSFLAGIFILWNIDRIDAGLAGLSLSFAMNFTEQIMWTVRNYTSLEMSLNAVERVCEFSEIPQEAPAIIEPRPPASWPHSGAITVQNLEVKYAPDLEPVLHHISFSIEGQEKIGLVGRTGSGKSTIALALFRFVEPSDGKILIDEIDISSIGVEDLRTRITIIPQDPILFTGTIRSNLDAFSQYEDSEMLESLRRVHLIPSEEDEEETTSFSGDNINLFKNLDTPVSEGGKNFSQGQRQLLCLARALLRSSKIILMDEATASIDFAMDEKIQKMIRTEFADCTILCIAHRLRTVIDYDRILVIDRGNVMEFDSPYNLITDSNSLFYRMCQNSGEFDLLMSLASKRGKKLIED